MLIAGGNKGSVDKIRAFLVNRGVVHLDHVVCSHPHDDHAGGLVELIKDESLSFVTAWVHKPHEHVDRNAMESSLSKRAALKTAQIVLRSLRTTDDLLTALDARSIPVEEPFENKKIAFLEVCGPSEQYYRQLLEAFTDPDSVLKESIHHTLGDSIESLMVLKSSSSPTLETAPVTTPENNSSVILRTKQNGKTYLFTADAGAPALDGVKRSHALAGCWWMQIPHHGSRRNITADLIEHFSPTVAYVSADGSEKHSSLVGRFGE